ncbi:hypothetical protein [Bradyrhizobium paxllaeri]|uniref:hypothetical protein n=1 Tax=Bradyrhizobium paxllaeri TaxID=190148 RepID=UPI000810D506|nr:hypothetical protein [Bradyrhizobium paxllaeri]
MIWRISDQRGPGSLKPAGIVVERHRENDAEAIRRELVEARQQAPTGREITPNVVVREHFERNVRRDNLCRVHEVLRHDDAKVLGLAMRLGVLLSFWMLRSLYRLRDRLPETDIEVGQKEEALV